MRYIYFFVVAAISILFSCMRSVDGSEDRVVVLSVAESSASKTDALTVGDEVAVFGCIEGTDNYFLEGAKFITGSDGKSLSTSPAVYYPEGKQAVQFFTYFPYHTGSFSVPTDQSTVAALKQADLCWAAASTTPTDTPISLVFAHQMARLVVKVNQTPDKITVPNVFSGGTLDIKTGTLLDRTQSDVSTTGDVLVLPPQPLARLVLMVSGVEYVFTPTSAVDLVSGQTTVVELTLHPISQTATLATPVVVSDWTGKAASDQPREAVDNQFLAHWLVADYRFNQVNRIDLAIKDQTTNTTKDYAVSNVSMVSGSTVSAASYTFSLANLPDLHYPYTVTAIKFYQDATLIHTAPMEHGVARAGDVTLGWGQNISLTLSASSVSVGAQATSSNFTLRSNVPYTSTYTTGGSSAQGVGAQPPYTARAVTFTYPAQGWAPAAERKHVMTITPTVDYTGIPNKRTFTVTQAAVPLSFSITPSTFAASDNHTSTSFSLTSNVPYTSTYTTGCSSAQGVGNKPPYNNIPVTFTFPRRLYAGPAETHVMTITPTGYATPLTFTVTRPLVQPRISISGGGTIPQKGGYVTIRVETNAQWSVSGGGTGIGASGSGRGNGSFNISAQMNTLYSSRTATFTVSTRETFSGAQNRSQSVTVTQLGHFSK